MDRALRRRAPRRPRKPSTPSKPKTVYHVAVLFGALPVPATPQTAQLTPFENLKLLTPLPSVKQPLIIFRGVVARQERHVHARQRSDPARPRGVPAQRVAVRSDRPARRPVRAARISLADRPGLRLRTADRQHRLQQGLECSEQEHLPRRVQGRTRTARTRRARGDPDLRYSSQPGVLVFAADRAFAARRRHGR